MQAGIGFAASVFLTSLQSTLQTAPQIDNQTGLTIVFVSACIAYVSALSLLIAVAGATVLRYADLTPSCDIGPYRVGVWLCDQCAHMVWCLHNRGRQKQLQLQNPGRQATRQGSTKRWRTCLSWQRWDRKLSRRASAEAYINRYGECRRESRQAHVKSNQGAQMRAQVERFSHTLLAVNIACWVPAAAISGMTTAWFAYVQPLSQLDLAQNGVLLADAGEVKTASDGEILSRVEARADEAWSRAAIYCMVASGAFVAWHWFAIAVSMIGWTYGR